MNLIIAITIVLIAGRLLVKLWLERLNCRHVQARAGSVPSAFRQTIDEPAYQRSIEYTLARSRFRQVEIVIGAVTLALLLASHVLPWAYGVWSEEFGISAWVRVAFIFALAIGASAFALPLDWYYQFRLEARFGFNTATARLWWTDKLKGLLLSLLLGYPLLVLILFLVDWTGDHWWLWAWGVVLLFQFVMAVLAPVIILPLFNKFTPLPEGALRERLVALAQRTGFKAGGIQVMDGSKRSLHSNAFFIGFGRFRKIVFFDTLMNQLDDPELEAVLAHEIGHFKKGHIPKMLLWSAVTLLAGLYVIAWLARQEWFFAAFGFATPDLAIALLLFGLLSGLISFWFSPVFHWWSRRYEYQADAFAARHSDAASLITALRKLTTKNLSNLVPHPFYSRFYYSHPTLLEREAALRT